jgi:TolA-binding protein
VDAKFPEAVKKYKDVIAQFDGTRAAHEARLALGTLYYNHGAPAEAVPLFQAAAGSATGSFEKSVALESWGYALENDGKYAEAITAFEKAANYAEGSVKGDSLLAIARCHEAMHDVAKARSTYDQILSQLPNTDAAKAAEGLKAKL